MLFSLREDSSHEVIMQHNNKFQHILMGENEKKMQQCIENVLQQKKIQNVPADVQSPHSVTVEVEEEQRPQRVRKKTILDD